jgi:hypothetical protein
MSPSLRHLRAGYGLPVRRTLPGHNHALSIQAKHVLDAGGALRVASTRNPQGVTEMVEMPGRGHALIIDSHWREVADTALAFVQRFTSPQPAKTGPAGS